MTRWTLSALLVLISACTSNEVLRDEEYERALTAYRLGDYEGATESFPRKERGGFITTVERSWIDLWRERYGSRPLLAHGDAFDGRRFLSITREAQTFLISETEEGYIPSEAERAVLHLLAATHLLQERRRESARVELRRADQILSGAWDDPALRLWCASLWSALGEWWEAQVDLRRAHEMTGDPAIARLAESPVPRALTLAFHGAGPSLEWNAGEFEPRFAIDSRPPAGEIVLSTSPWYERHRQRNHEVREALLRSNYMAQYLGGETLTLTEKIGTYATTWGLRAAGTAIAGAVVVGAIYVLSQGGSDAGEAAGYVGALGIGIGAASWNKAKEIEKNWRRIIEEDREKRLRRLRTYRLVRFLPEYIELKTEEVGICPTCKRVELATGPSPTAVTLIQQL